MADCRSFVEVLKLNVFWQPNISQICFRLNYCIDILYCWNCEMSGGQGWIQRLCTYIAVHMNKQLPKRTQNGQQRSPKQVLQLWISAQVLNFGGQHLHGRLSWHTHDRGRWNQPWIIARKWISERWLFHGLQYIGITFAEARKNSAVGVYVAVSKGMWWFCKPFQLLFWIKWNIYLHGNTLSLGKTFTWTSNVLHLVHLSSASSTSPSIHEERHKHKETYPKFVSWNINELDFLHWNNVTWFIFLGLSSSQKSPNESLWPQRLRRSLLRKLGCDLAEGVHNTKDHKNHRVVPAPSSSRVEENEGSEPHHSQGRALVAPIQLLQLWQLFFNRSKRLPAHHFRNKIQRLAFW